MDINKALRKLGNRTIVNQDIVTLEDRNIDSIVLNCYKNLYQAKLAGYTIEHSDSSTEFQCEFKAQIDKLKSRHKDKLNKKKYEDDDRTELQKILSYNNVQESINLKSLHNNFKILKLKYILDPVNTINSNHVLQALGKTLENWDLEVGSYQHIETSTKEYLEFLQREYTEKLKKGEIEVDRAMDPITANTDLFVKEQMVLIPIYNNDSKYVIDGIKYYGVFNNNDLGNLTKAGAYGVKVFKNGKISTIYMLLIDDVLYINYFKSMHNLCHIVSMYNACDVPMERILPKTDDPRLQQIFKNTYKHAQLLEQNSPELTKYSTYGKCIIPDANKSFNNGRANYSDDAYVTQIFAAVKEYIKLKDEPGLRKVRKYSFLSKLEEEIYAEMNGKKIVKKGDLINVKKRINLSPLTVLTVIKKGAGENVSNMLFTSTSSESNPFDIFYLFGFMSGTTHTETRVKKGASGAKVKEEDKILKWNDSLYIGEFCPKSENNIGRATTLRLGLSSEHIQRRKPIS